MESCKRHGIVTGLICVSVLIAAIAVSSVISGFGFYAIAWYTIATVQIISLLAAVSLLYLTEHEDRREGKRS